MAFFVGFENSYIFGLFPEIEVAMHSGLLKDIQIHDDWKDFLTPQVKRVLDETELLISSSDYTPEQDKVLRFMSLPLSDAKVVILGQDPYPQPGVATGRAFEVGTLRSWTTPFRNISLKNILRALYRTYFKRVISYSELKKRMGNEFPILPPTQLFVHWEQQGVLLLNTAFTCELNQPGSHKKIWENFSRELLQYIRDKNPDITWFLWGKDAQEAVSGLNLKNSIRTHHPMMCFARANRPEDFLYGKINCFEQMMDVIDWTGFQLNPETIANNPKLF